MRAPSPCRVVASVAVFLLAGSAAAATLPPGFTETQLASGLANPTAMALAPDGRTFVCLQGGQLRVIKNGQLLPTPFLTVTVDSAGERGLLGVAFDPEFASNQFVYVYYTATTPTIHNRVSRFTASGDVAVAGSEATILDLNGLTGATNHNGGALHFGPDGRLYIAVGENATPANAQTLDNLLGKMLRINKDGTIPADNPFFGQASGVNRAIWALGLRNPFTFAFQPGTGRMFVNDVGQSTWEEVNDGVAGANYGWPDTEGPTTDPRFQTPLFAYTNDASTCAITGGTFYNPASVQFPSDYTGKYFFADFCGGWIRRLDPATNPPTVTGFATGISNPVDLRVDPAGNLYYLARGTGAVWRVQFTGNQAPQITSHPASLTVAAGQSATFSVGASGTAPLSYRWQRDGVDIAGATAASYTLASATLADSGAAFRAIVTNSFGSATSNSATLTVTANSPPTALISTPAHGTLYSAGDTINFAGGGNDPEDGALPVGALTWRVDFHHDDHTHPFVPSTSGIAGGSFVIPTTGETSANVWYRIHLTVRDSGGLTHATFSDVVPRTATITLATNPAGLQLTLDGQPVTTPFSVEGVVGIQRTLGAPSPQIPGATTYVFQTWSDGGAATHTIGTPLADTTFTATFQVTTAPVGLGLLGTYFNDVGFTGGARTRLDPAVAFDWGTGAPLPGMGADTFSVRWRGRVRPKVTGTHTFYTTSDDGVRLWVNYQLIIDNWTDHAPTENSGVITLTAGQRYDIRLEMYENGGGAVARLSWSAPGLAKEVVPQSHLHPYALVVAGSATLGPGDAAVRARLQSLGYHAVVRTAAEAIQGDAAGKSVVLLSSTVNSSAVNTKFRAVVNPLLSWEPNLCDDLGMTGPTSGTHYGTLAGQSQVVIASPSHPLAAGLTGTVGVTSVGTTFVWGVPAASAVQVARPLSNGGRSLIFGYERGAVMNGLAAPGRRVGFFLGDAAAGSLTTPGWALFDAAVAWASGR